MLNTIRAVLLASTAVIPLASSAFGIEPKAAADALAAALAKGSDAKASYESASAEGSNVVIVGLSLTRGPEDPTVTFARTVIETPTEEGNGVFQSPRLDFTDGAVSGKATGSIAAASLTGVTVLDPAEVKGDGLGESILFATAEATDIRATQTDHPGEITVARFHSEAGNVVDNIAQDNKGAVEDIVIPSAVLSTSTVKPEALGYESLVLDVSWDGTRDIAAGTMTLRDLTVNIENGGEFKLQAVLGDLPNPRVLNDPNATDAASKTKVHRLSFHYDDNSLAGRILDYLASQQGISRADYAQQMSAALPFLLSMLNNADFQAQVSTAVGAFLQDPKSLTIKVEPEQPVSADEITGLLVTSPQTLPDRLKASISANTPE